MALLEWIVPTLLKRNIKKGIHNLSLLALSESQRQRLPSRRAILWETLSGAAAGVMQQLFVENPNPAIDWGLKGNRHRLNQEAIIRIYYWMVLYQLILLRAYGLESYNTEDEFRELGIIARQFVEYIASVREIGVEPPRPWHETWETQSPEEAAVGLYESVMKALGLPDKIEERLVRAVLFSTESHRLYDLIVRTIVQKRIEEHG